MKKSQLIIIGLCGQSVFLQVPHFHQPEETLHAQNFFSEPGGKGYNQAVAAARMGADVLFAAAIGQDADGLPCQQHMKSEGLQCCFFPKEDAHTAYAVILTDQAGENRVTVYPGASKLLTGADVRSLSDAFKQARYLLLTPEISQEAFAEAAALATAAGLRLIINPAPYQPWVQPYLRQAWCITPNRREVMDLLNLDDDDDLEKALLKSPYQRAVVTLGKQGALCLENGIITKIPAPQVSPVDTTGAGDALNGVLCAELLNNKTLVDATRIAVQAASYSVTHAHVLPSLPTRAQLESSSLRKP